MLDIPAWETPGIQIRQFGIGEAGEWILQEQELKLLIALEREVACLPKKACVFKVPVLDADLMKTTST
jgi:hypothetical protein